MSSDDWQFDGYNLNVDNEAKVIREAMRLLGSRTSEAKKRSSRANAAKPRPNARKPRKRLAEVPCNCGGVGLNHKAGCLRGRAIRYRQKKGLPLT